MSEEGEGRWSRTIAMEMAIDIEGTSGRGRAHERVLSDDHRRMRNDAELCVPPLGEGKSADGRTDDYIRSTTLRRWEGEP